MLWSLQKSHVGIIYFGPSWVIQSGRESREIETEQLEPLTTITKTYLADALGERLSIAIDAK